MDEAGLTFYSEFHIAIVGNCLGPLLPVGGTSVQEMLRGRGVGWIVDEELAVGVECLAVKNPLFLARGLANQVDDCYQV